MVIDPVGDVMAEWRFLGSDIALAACTYQKISVLGAAHSSKQKVAWMLSPEQGVGAG